MIRKAIHSDIDQLLLMMREFYAIDNYPIDLAHSRLLFEEFLANENLGNCWLILDSDKISGYMIFTYIFSFEYGGKIGFIDELFVKPEARKKGLGKLAVDFAIETAKASGLKLLYLEAEPHNELAIELYRSKGFSMHKRQLLRYKLNK